MAFDAQDIVDGFDEPKLPADLAVPDATVVLITFPPAVAGAVGATYGASIRQLRTLLAFAPAVKLTPPMPTFADVVNSAAGGSLRIVPAPGVLMSDYRYKIGLYGNYVTAPLDGIVSVGTANTAVYAYSVETATNNQSGTARSVDFIPVPALPVGGAPSFVNFNDLANVVTLLPATGQLAADYSYKIGSYGIYAATPADGVITVGNVAGQVFAYLQASAAHTQSATVASPSFTISLAQLPSVRFDAPLAGATLNYGAAALLSVIATDAAGIASVEFFNGSTSIGTGTSNGSEYVLYWTPTTGASANLTAKATNTVGVVGTATNYVLLQTTPAAPAAPTGVFGVAGNALVTVGWTAPNTYGAPIIRYDIFANGLPVPVGNSTVPYFVDRYAVNGTPYYYTIVAYTSGGFSVNSQASVAVTPMAPVVAKTVPDAPIMGYANPNTTSISLYFTAPINNGGAPISYYNIYRNGSSQVFDTSNSPFYSDAKVLPGVTYSYAVLAVNSVGPSLLSGNSAGVMLLIPPSPVVTANGPGIPTAVTAVAGPASLTPTITVNAVPPVVPSGQPAIIGYIIFRFTGGVATLLNNTPSSLPYQDTTAVNGTTYTYTVAAVNSVGTGIQSTASPAVMPMAPAPTAPTYNTTLTGPGPITIASGQPGAGITLTSGGVDVLKFNSITGGSSLAQRMNISISGTVVAAVDFPASYVGAGFSYTPASGTLHSGTFANSTVII